MNHEDLYGAPTLGHLLAGSPALGHGGLQLLCPTPSSSHCSGPHTDRNLEAPRIVPERQFKGELGGSFPVPRAQIRPATQISRSSKENLGHPPGFSSLGFFLVVK